MPSDCFALSAIFLLLLSFNAGTRSDTNEDWLLSFFCRCGVFFSPVVIKRRPVNDGDTTLQNVREEERRPGSLRSAVWEEEEAGGCLSNLRSRCGNSGPSQTCWTCLC